MSDAGAADPIAQLLAGHQHTRQQLARLADPTLRDQAAAWFDRQALAQRRILRDTLFPALIESMAGSDAVCLKGMTQGLADLDTELQHRWHAIRPHLGDSLPSATLRAWTDDYLDYLQRADEELLPMAGRLLDDAALDQLRCGISKDLIPAWMGH